MIEDFFDKTLASGELEMRRQEHALRAVWDCAGAEVVADPLVSEALARDSERSHVVS